MTGLGWHARRLGPAGVVGVVLATALTFAAYAAATNVRVPNAIAIHPTACAGAPAGYPNLGAAAGFAVFALNSPGPTQSVNLSNDTITGDVGVASGATVTNQASSTIIGNVFVDSGGSFSGPGTVNGTVFTSQNLAPARTDAINASISAAALSPNFTFGNITSTTTVSGVSGLNVVSVTGNINLNNASLILSGPADAFFVVNVAGSITLAGTGGIVVGGSVAPSQLLINMTGTGSLLQTQIGNVIQGTLLGPNVGGSLDGAFGSVLLGGNFSPVSGVHGTFQGCRPPTAVTVRAFSARRSPAGVELRWRTGSEADLAGFDVYRGSKKLNRALLTAHGALGASYSFVDRAACTRATYTYRLQAVARNGSRAWVGLARVTAR